MNQNSYYWELNDDYDLINPQKIIYHQIVAHRFVVQ